MILFENDNDNVSKLELELESEPKEEQAYLLLKEKMILNYSPVINPRGRPRGRDILPDEEKVSVSFEHVQQQIGGNDCRLFALAFATSHCYKDVPSLMFYDQLSLRDHYVKCIENNEIQAFLSKSKRGSTRNASKLVDIYFELIFFCCCVIILVNLYLCAINN
ncbi:unnamed protein product [Rotaria magnacalcarata]|uniref:Uncharacterized protein n=1 Tax=Rotaria magnacalcarata TaxID=392030 RepID=A0A820GDF6_9BILA|nr:unnamed protein product [Rotaria magnacalcarata]CAF4276504.1 unnamed protein product [Rotaria magnacalcarata]CAF4312435.1 unnamed protein product [Rotaria magnacalcarata]